MHIYTTFFMALVKTCKIFCKRVKKYKGKDHIKEKIHNNINIIGLDFQFQISAGFPQTLNKIFP